MHWSWQFGFSCLYPVLTIVRCVWRCIQGRDSTDAFFIHQWSYISVWEVVRPFNKSCTRGLHTDINTAMSTTSYREYLTQVQCQVTECWGQHWSTEFFFLQRQGPFFFFSFFFPALLSFEVQVKIWSRKLWGIQKIQLSPCFAISVFLTLKHDKIYYENSNKKTPVHKAQHTRDFKISRVSLHCTETIIDQIHCIKFQGFTGENATYFLWR